MLMFRDIFYKNQQGFAFKFFNIGKKWMKFSLKWLKCWVNIFAYISCWE